MPAFTDSDVREANEIVEITSEGVVVDRLDISSFGRTTIEGLTMDDLGNIYLVSEGTPTSDNPEDRGSRLHVISAVPEPSICSLALLGLAGSLAASRVRRGVTK